MATTGSSKNTGLTFDGFDMSTYGLDRGARMFHALRGELESAFLAWTAEAEKAAAAVGDGADQATYRKNVLEPAYTIQKALYASVCEFSAALDASRLEYAAADAASTEDLAGAGG